MNHLETAKELMAIVDTPGDLKTANDVRFTVVAHALIAIAEEKGNHTFELNCLNESLNKIAEQLEKMNEKFDAVLKHGLPIEDIQK